MSPRTSKPKDKGTAGSVTLTVKIQPRASRNEIIRMEGGGLKIRLMAPPVDGAANEALIRLLADTFSVPKSRVEIVSGHASREKIVRITGVAEADVLKLLNIKDK